MQSYSLPQARILRNWATQKQLKTMTTSEIASSEIPKPERTWAMFAHLSSFLGYTCIPLASIIAPPHHLAD